MKRKKCMDGFLTLAPEDGRRVLEVFGVLPDMLLSDFRHLALPRLGSSQGRQVFMCHALKRSKQRKRGYQSATDIVQVFWLVDVEHWGPKHSLARR
jgi:hypothetical protein